MVLIENEDQVSVNKTMIILQITFVVAGIKIEYNVL